MGPVRFIHCADLHIDCPFKGIADVHPDFQNILYQSTYRSFENVIDLAIQEQVDCVLIAGDVYNSANKSLHAQIKFRNGLKRLSDAGIRSFVVYGNHDPLDSWSATLEWPEHVTIFGGDKVEQFPLLRDKEVIARIHGISFLKRDIHDNLSLQFEGQDDDIPDIGLLHSNVGRNTGHQPYAPASIKDLSSRRIDYWALGHVHRHIILREDHPAIVYPGNSQAILRSESGKKGCCLVTLHPNGKPEIQFISTDVFRYMADRVDVTGSQSHDDVIRAIISYCEALSDSLDHRHAMIRLELIGRTDIHKELQKGNHANEIIEEVRDYFHGREPWIWLEHLSANTAGPYDMDALRQGDHFISDLISLYDDLMADNGDLWEEIKRVQEPLFSNWQGRRCLEDPSKEELLRLIEEARNRTLDSLIMEE